jgi:CRP/FNR family transcriptional regulator
MARADIADHLGLTAETVGRTLAQLRSSGLVELLPGGRVRLKDEAALTAAAGAPW